MSREALRSAIPRSGKGTVAKRYEACGRQRRILPEWTAPGSRTPASASWTGRVSARPVESCARQFGANADACHVEGAQMPGQVSLQSPSRPRVRPSSGQGRPPAPARSSQEPGNHSRCCLRHIGIARNTDRATLAPLPSSPRDAAAPPAQSGQTADPAGPASQISIGRIDQPSFPASATG